MRKNVFSMALTVGALVSALFIAGCGNSSTAAPAATATPTNTPTPSPTPVLNSTFNSTDGVYTFQFPGDWSSTPVNNGTVINGVVLTSPDSQNFFYVSPTNTGIPASQYSAVLQGVIQALGGTNAKIKAAGNVTFGKNTWAVDEGTATLKGTAYDGTQFALSHHGKSFFVIVAAPHSTADTIGTTFFQPMLTSLTFLK